jgi:tRNA dimethylallyltransferase
LKKIIVIGGPTASGKTGLAIQVAKFFETEIISADSRQVYKELTIGSAKPTDDQLLSIRHHFINHISIADDFNAAVFAQEARLLIESLFKQKEIIVICGGSGLYIDALLNGLNELPASDPSIRKELIKKLADRGLTTLQDEIKTADPEYALNADIYNSQRLLRALEVIYITGQPYSSFINKKKTGVPYPFIYYCLNPERKQLYASINTRTDQMIQNGLIEESKNLYAYRNNNALNTVGYKEIFEMMDGKGDIQLTIDKIKQHTRNYAKRQMTWYKRLKDIIYINPEEAFEIITK